MEFTKIITPALLVLCLLAVTFLVLVTTDVVKLTNAKEAPFTQDTEYTELMDNYIILQGQYAELQEQYTAIESQIDTLQSELDDMANKYAESVQNDITIPTDFDKVTINLEDYTIAEFSEAGIGFTQFSFEQGIDSTINLTYTADSQSNGDIIVSGSIPVTVTLNECSRSEFIVEYQSEDGAICLRIYALASGQYISSLAGTISGVIFDECFVDKPFVLQKTSIENNGTIVPGPVVDGGIVIE